MLPSEITEARESAKRLRDNLPPSVDVAALGVVSKAPFKLLCAREALIWRTEELARNACDALERDDLAVAAILTRAITESAALVWTLMELLDSRDKYSPGEFSDLLMRGVVGSREWEELPNPFQVLACVDRMDKKIPGVRASYNSLSEIAHPNWRGALGLYSKIDQEQFVTHFGRGLRGESAPKMIVKALVPSLGLFEYAYKRISDAMPGFISELEPIWPDEKV